MTNRGDDCYFFYYSTCTKGDSCPFRHCEAAIGSETVCTLWQEGRCFRNTCKFRHMEITHNRKEIPCYWENQATGCQKPHCAFFHEKPRYIDGVFVSPDKNVGKNVEQPQEEPASIQPPPPNSQRRETVKMDTQVPSPTHPPVVINPAEDEDEDEDEDAEISISPRKPPPSDSLHFGVSTMEEIRLKKALKASMRRAGYPMLDENTSTSKEKENIQTMFGGDLSATSDGSLFESMDEMGGPTLMVTEHLGKKKLHSDVRHGEDAPQNHRLGERLGKIVTTEALPTPSHKDLKPVKERLGPGAAQPGEAVVEPQKAPGKIHIKTLEEIRLEKAARLKDCRSADAPETSSSKAAEREKHVPIDKVQSSGQVRTFSEVRFAKRKRKQEPDTGTQKVPGQSQPEESAAAGLGPAAPNPAGIRVKTLEEIRREKATRILSKHDCKAENNNLDAENAVKKTHLLRLSRRSLPPEKSLDVTEKPLRPQAAAETLVANGDGVKVKTFEEIMQEKRLRKQELEEQAKGFAETDPLRKQTAERTLKRKVPSASPAKVPVKKLISLKSKAPASPLNRDDSQSPDSSKENPDAQSQRSVEMKQAKAAKEPEQEHPADTKVRPKLNVKPSVMKPSVQLKPAQKRRGAERSAVAAVKPLNSTSVPEQPGQEMAADTQLSSAVPCGPAVNSHSGSSPLKEELQTVPVFGQGQETPPCVPIATEPCPVPQSPVQQTPPPSKARRMSLTAPRAVSTSAMDDFEELISEFADDHLVQGEVDTDMAEDELLQELSQMIDS